ncbi:MAG: efflux RND transporter periplasmic adaptor subunit [Candidatus Eremiobacteraeota bacterium]|nr:efflux RND transporter periplasmic adaptor subunit [Candidatus Eremiobacteraeota bacterium]
MSKKTRNILIVTGALLFFIVVALVIPHGGSSATVKTQTIRYTEFSTKLPENGVVQRPLTQTIATLISGNLGAILVKPGDRVAEGQVLATIVNPQITSAAQSSGDAYRSAAAHARSASYNAEVNLLGARQRLTQAEADLANGVQSGLGYGNSTEADLRAQAEGNLTNAATGLREARRVYEANVDLYNNKAISLDALDQAKAKLEQAQVAYDQASRALESFNSSQGRERQVLVENVAEARQGLAQAEAAASASGGGTDVAAAQADAARAADDYAYAEAQADATRIRAPFAGIVQSIATQPNDALRQLQPGDPISAGAPIFTLAASDAFIVRAKVDEQDIESVAAGQRATITGEDFPGKTLFGRVAVISPVAQRSDDPSSTARQVLTTIRLDASPAFLRDGMSVDVDIHTAEISHAIVVPNDAIVTEGGLKYVWIVQNGVAHKQRVRIGQSNDVESVVRSGLSSGQTIVAEKPTDVSEGTRIVAATPNPSPSP